MCLYVCILNRRSNLLSENKRMMVKHTSLRVWVRVSVCGGGSISGFMFVCLLVCYCVFITSRLNSRQKRQKRRPLCDIHHLLPVTLSGRRGRNSITDRGLPGFIIQRITPKYQDLHAKRQLPQGLKDEMHKMEMLHQRSPAWTANCGGRLGTRRETMAGVKMAQWIKSEIIHQHQTRECVQTAILCPSAVKTFNRCLNSQVSSKSATVRAHACVYVFVCVLLGNHVLF